LFTHALIVISLIVGGVPFPRPKKLPLGRASNLAPRLFHEHLQRIYGPSRRERSSLHLIGEEQFYLFWPLIISFVPQRCLLPVIEVIAINGFGRIRLANFAFANGPKAI
jgi:hypothetical protein